MSHFYTDIKYAIRQLFKHPLVAGIAVLTLSLGMAGNTVIFSIVNGFFLRPLPFYDSEQLVDIDQTAPRWNLPYTGNAYPDFHAWREQNQSFSDMTVWSNRGYTVRVGEVVERINGTRVTHDIFPMLGIKAAMGQVFTQDYDVPGANRVVVLTHGLWQRLFGGRDVVGDMIQLNREPYTIIGVLAETQKSLCGGDLWVPLAGNLDQRDGWYLRGAARLKPDVTLAMAQQDLNRIHQGLIEKKLTNENTSPRLTLIQERYFGDARPILMILMTAVGVLLLIACGNVASLMLARGLARWRELGIRMSLGATPARMVRLIGTESLLLSCLAAASGLFLGYWGVQALINSIAEDPPQWVSFNLDARIYVYAGFMVLLTATLGAIPTCLTVIRGHARASLNVAGQYSTGTPKKRRSLHGLVVGEVALTLLLLIQTGLLISAFRTLQKQDQGFRSDHVLTYVIDLPGTQYQNSDAWQSFFDRHLERVRDLPGVMEASAVNATPLGAHNGNFYEIEHAPVLQPNDQDPVVLERIAYPGYFEAMGIQCVAGRPFHEQDGVTEGALAVIVNQTFAKRFWPNQDPIGKRLRSRGNANPWMTVVGVTHDTKHYGPETPMIPGLFLPYAQAKRSAMTLVVHTQGDPLSLVSAIREIVKQADPDLPVFSIQTMSEKLQTSLWARRLYSNLITIFAGVALVMAVGGLYGVFSYVTNGRVREMGVRIAVGAEPKVVLWMVLTQALKITTLGIVFGLIVAAVVIPFMSRMLLGIHWADVLTFVGVPLAMMLVAIAACWIPARRASRINPVEALRYE